MAARRGERARSDHGGEHVGAHRPAREDRVQHRRINGGEVDHEVVELQDLHRLQIVPPLAAVGRIDVGDHEATAAAPHPEVGGLAGEHRRVDALSAPEPVVAGTAHERVVAGIAVDAVPAIAAREPVVSGAAVDAVVARATPQGVVTGTGLHAVVAAARIDGVGAERADQIVVALGTDDVAAGDTGEKGGERLAVDREIGHRGEVMFDLHLARPVGGPDDQRIPVIEEDQIADGQVRENEGVTAPGILDLVAAEQAREHEGVVAEAAVEPVVARTSVDDVVAVEAVDAVTAGRAGQGVVARRPEDRPLVAAMKVVGNVAEVAVPILFGHGGVSSLALPRPHPPCGRRSGPGTPWCTNLAESWSHEGEDRAADAAAPLVPPLTLRVRAPIPTAAVGP